jgi:hypothetical protein
VGTEFPGSGRGICSGGTSVIEAGNFCLSPASVIARALFFQPSVELENALQSLILSTAVVKAGQRLDEKLCALP